ncbi:hypothetical protein [Nocardia sp. NPDC057030]|uniref:hypothetical protein n=1 Tax=unclassified Nocardia TaxID=2637762 RepID=UPI00364229D0
MTRIALAALLSLTVLGTVSVGATTAVAQQLRPERFSLTVRPTVRDAGTTYTIDGSGWAHDATVHVYVDGWTRAPSTRSWGQAYTDARGSFHLSRFEPFDPGEQGKLQLSVVDPDTGHRSTTPISLR